MPVPVRIAKPVIAAATAVLVVGCGSSSPSQPAATPTSAPSPTSGASASPGEAAAPGLLLEVTSEGGFINPVARLGAVPSVVVDDDGRILTPGAPVDPQPLIPPVDVRDTREAGAAAIREAIATAGLDAQEAGGGVVADTGTTVFTTVVDGDLVVNRFAAGGGSGRPAEPGGPGAPGGDTPSGSPAPGASADPAARAFALLHRLVDPHTAWGSSVAAAEPYRPQGYRVFTAPATPDASASGASTAPSWPLATPLASFGSPAAANLGVDGLRSGIVTGAEATALSAALQGLPAGGPLESDGQPWSIWVQPLFPDELPG